MVYVVCGVSWARDVGCVVGAGGVGFGLYVRRGCAQYVFVDSYFVLHRSVIEHHHGKCKLYSVSR